MVLSCLLEMVVAHVGLAVPCHPGTLSEQYFTSCCYVLTRSRPAHAQRAALPLCHVPPESGGLGGVRSAGANVWGRESVFYPG